jgi:hypothetical protein
VILSSIHRDIARALIAPLRRVEILGNKSFFSMDLCDNKK